MDTTSTTSTSKIPLNRIIAFAGPYIAILSGAIADWLIVHVHLLGLFHTSKTAVTGVITQGVVFGLTAILVWLGHQKWLTGWQNYEGAILNAVAPELVNGPDVAADQHPSQQGDYDPATAGGGAVPVVPDDQTPLSDAQISAAAAAEGIESPPPPPPRGRGGAV